MKINKILILFLTIGCILVAGYFTRSIPIALDAKPGSSGTAPLINTTVPLSASLTVPATAVPSANARSAPVTISIGDYDALLPVSVDAIPAGNVSKDRPLHLNLAEGTHIVSLCEGTVCESLYVDISPPLKTTVDFGKRLKLDSPPGLLILSAGDYPAHLTVFVDAVETGMIIPGVPFNQTIKAGNHTVSACLDERCFNDTVTIRPGSATALDLRERLNNEIVQGAVTVSIGGYNAELPVLIDNTTVGTAAMGRPLNIRINTGNHTVRVCAGNVCEEEVVQVTFAKPSVVDFGSRLEKDVEFQEPTVRIVNSYVSGTTMTVEVEFINTDTIDHTISATVSCVYSYNDAQRFRRSDSVQSPVTRLVKAGDRVSLIVSLSLSGGSGVIANEPVVSDIVVN